MDTIGKVFNALFVVVLAFNLLAWQHFVLGFDGRSIQMVNAMEIVVALLASITLRNGFIATLNKVFTFIENRNDKRGCDCGKLHA